MTVKGRKPPHNDKPTVTTVEPTRNAKSCVRSQMQQQNTTVDPTRPDAMRMDMIVRKLTVYGIVGLMRPHIGITMAASRIDTKIKKRNSNSAFRSFNNE